MTSRIATRIRRIGLAAMLLTSLTGCASLPDDAPVVEQLDEQTGATITRLGRPLELYRETFRQAAPSRFAFFGPFETNQMGEREVFLWIAVPTDEGTEPTPPSVSVDGAPLTLGEAAREPDLAGLRQSPYRIPMPWLTSYYFRIDADARQRLGSARTLDLDALESDKNGPVRVRYSLEVGDDPRLREFAAR